MKISDKNAPIPNLRLESRQQTINLLSKEKQKLDTPTTTPQLKSLKLCKSCNTKQEVNQNYICEQCRDIDKILVDYFPTTGSSWEETQNMITPKEK